MGPGLMGFKEASWTTVPVEGKALRWLGGCFPETRGW